MRGAAEQLVDGQGSPGDRVINLHRWEEYPGSHFHGLIPVHLVGAHSMESLGWENHSINTVHPSSHYDCF